MSQKDVETYDQVDFAAAIKVKFSKTVQEEDQAATPTLHMKENPAELYFPTGESKSNTSNSTSEQSDKKSSDSCASHLKTPKMSNMRRLLGNLTDDLASPEKVVQPASVAKPITAPRPRPARVVMKDSSSSSSGNADSNKPSGAQSDSSWEGKVDKKQTTATATSRETSTAKKKVSKTPSAQQAEVAKRLLQRQPHAISHLQPASESGGVIWNLDTPALDQTMQPQLSQGIKPQISAADWSTFPPAACHGMITDPWSVTMLNQALPTVSAYAPVSPAYARYPQPLGPFMQPQTPEQFVDPAMGSSMAGSTFTLGADHFAFQPQGNYPVHHSYFSTQDSYTQVQQQIHNFFCMQSQEMQRAHAQHVQASKVRCPPVMSCMVAVACRHT